MESGSLAALVAVAILGGLVCFQLLLVAGAPLGNYAWGGANRILPRGFRIASVVACFVYVLTGLVILQAAGLVSIVGSRELARTVAWVLAAFFALGTVMNAISRSRKERVMAPVALALGVLCVIVAR